MGAAAINSILQKDAYLVFRALCKLSIRSPDGSTGADLTVLRGKARPPTSCFFPRLSSAILGHHGVQAGCVDKHGP